MPRENRGSRVDRAAGFTEGGGQAALGKVWSDLRGTGNEKEGELSQPNSFPGDRMGSLLETPSKTCEKKVRLKQVVFLTCFFFFFKDQHPISHDSIKDLLGTEILSDRLY